MRQFLLLFCRSPQHESEMRERKVFLFFCWMVEDESEVTSELLISVEVGVVDVVEVFPVLSRLPQPVRDIDLLFLGESLDEEDEKAQEKYLVTIEMRENQKHALLSRFRIWTEHESPTVDFHPPNPFHHSQSSKLSSRLDWHELKTIESWSSLLLCSQVFPNVNWIIAPAPGTVNTFHRFSLVCLARWHHVTLRNWLTFFALLAWLSRNFGWLTLIS